MATSKRSIKVIGCGGIGTCLLPPLCRFLNYGDEKIELMLIDGDIYEEKNRARQSFKERGNKADVTADGIRDEFPELYVSTTTEYLTEDNIILTLRNEDIIFLCVDNNATRKLVNDRCLKLENVVLISGGNELTDGNIHVFIREKGKNVTMSLADRKSCQGVKEPQDKNPGEGGAGGGSCQVQAVSAPQLLFMNNTIATLMCNAYYGYLQGVFHGKQKDQGKPVYDEVYADLLLNAARAKLNQ
jgi:molybdopterin/thiamine biosynthesis adenylyltransferase